MTLFAVTPTRGEAWARGRVLEQQVGWRPHADFMDALAAEGFVILGGPLEGTDDVLLIVRAQGADQVRARLAADPWEAQHLLRTITVLPWTLRLGKLV